MKNKKSEKKNGKKIAIIVIVALLAAAVILCVLLPKSSPADPDESAAPTESVAPASPDNSKPGSTKPDNKPSASPEASAAPTESAAPAQPGNTGSNQNTGSGSQATPGQSGGSTGNQSNTNTGNTQSGNQNSNSTEHQHNWQPVYKTAHHDEKGHYETVVVQAAWDEPEYELRTVCNACGYMGSDVPDHIWIAHDGAGSYGSIPVATGNTIHHEAVTEQRWIVDTPAYDEQVIAGYKCSCGQEKLA